MKGETLAIAAVLGQMDGFLAEPASALIARYESLFQRYCPLPALYEALSGRGELADILAQAALLAQGAHGADGGAGGALRVIFGGLSVEEGGQAPLYYPVRPLSADRGMFPVSAPQGREADLAAQRAAFYRDMDRIAQNPPRDGAAFVQLLDTVLQTYTWCLPGRWGDGDVSLYDTARITAAIAACLGQHRGGEEPFLLISGDFSGIQSYLFAAARTSAREVAKRLRARSFLIDATISALAHTAARRLEVPCQNLLMLCGGKFQLLAPNRPGQAQRLEALRRETDRYLFERYKGEISVNLAWISFGPEGFSDYGGTVTRLAQRLREEKNRPFAGQLAGGGLAGGGLLPLWGPVRQASVPRLPEPPDPQRGADLRGVYPPGLRGWTAHPGGHPVVQPRRRRGGAAGGLLPQLLPARGGRNPSGGPAQPLGDPARPHLLSPGCPAHGQQPAHRPGRRGADLLPAGRPVPRGRPAGGVQGRRGQPGLPLCRRLPGRRAGGGLWGGW